MSEQTSTTSDQKAQEEQPTAPEGLSGRLVGAALILALGAFVALLDTTVVGVAMHAFTDSFNAGLAKAQWVSTAYLLAMASIIPVTGWAVKRFGAAKAWIASLCVFLVGSALCGIAWSLGSLISFRVLQGLGAGMLFPLMRIIVVELAGRERLGRMMSLIAIPILVAPIVGPIVGGAVVEDLSWRWAFYLNVPITIAVIVLSAIYIPNHRSTAADRLDVAGLVTMSGGLSLVIFGFSKLAEGRSVTDLQVVSPLVAGLLLLVAHGVRAARSQAAGIVEFGLFRDRSFAASSTVTFLNNFGLYGAVLLVPLFFQQAGGSGALSAGLVLAPQGLGMAVAVVVVGRIIDMKSNPRVVVLLGLLLVAVGTSAFALNDSGSMNPLLALALFVHGIGLTCAISPTMVTLYNSLPTSKVASATTANAITQQLGGAMGTAVIALLLQHFTQGSSGSVSGFHTVFWVSVGFVALTAIPALLLPAGDPKGRKALSASSS